MTKQPPNWLLPRECARRLTEDGHTPFTRQDLIDCVRQTKPGANPNSLNAMIQGITVNAPGGAPGGVGKPILWRVGHGLYELYRGQDGGDTGQAGGPSGSGAQAAGTPSQLPDAPPMPSPDDYSGDSSAQRQAEDCLVTEASSVLHAHLVKTRFDLAGGAVLEVDGYCAEPAILCEIWAHVGPPKTAQKHKVMTDALKLVYARDTLAPGARCILVFGSEEAARFFQGSSWMSACLKTMGVEVLVLEMPADLRDSVLAAQRRQYR